MVVHYVLAVIAVGTLALFVGKAVVAVTPADKAKQNGVVTTDGAEAAVTIYKEYPVAQAVHVTKLVVVGDPAIAVAVHVAQLAIPVKAVDPEVPPVVHETQTPLLKM